MLSVSFICQFLTSSGCEEHWVACQLSLCHSYLSDEVQFTFPVRETNKQKCLFLHAHVHVFVCMGVFMCGLYVVYVHTSIPKAGSCVHESICKAVGRFQASCCTSLHLIKTGSCTEVTVSKPQQFSCLHSP